MRATTGLHTYVQGVWLNHAIFASTEVIVSQLGVRMAKSVLLNSPFAAQKVPKLNFQGV
jgi:hypothetical protein